MTNAIFTGMNCNYKGLILDEDYDISAPPKNQTVESKVKILNIYEIDDIHQTILIYSKIYLRWDEPRIRINGTSPYVLRENTFARECIWSPKVMFSGQLAFDTDHMGTQQAFVLTNRKDRVLVDYSFNARSLISCPRFNFDKYPFDHQECSVILRAVTSKESFELDGFMYTDSILEWSDFNLQYEVRNRSVFEGSDKDYVMQYNKTAFGISLELVRYTSSSWK